MASSPSAPAKSASRGSQRVISGARPAASPSATYGRLATTSSHSPGGRPRTAVTSTSRPSRAALARARSTAAADASEAVTRRSGRSCASASATAPDPVPRSCTRAPAGSSSATSTSSSVSGRGIEHAPIDGHLDVAKAAAPEYVGHRLPGHAPAHPLADQPVRGWRDRHARVGNERGAVDADRVCHQQLGVQPRRLAARRLKGVGRGAHGLADRGRDWAHPASGEAASSLRRFSSASSAAVKSSSSPPSTRCTSPRVSFTRWSVTRSWGKL